MAQQMSDPFKSIITLAEAKRTAEIANAAAKEMARHCDARIEKAEARIASLEGQNADLVAALQRSKGWHGHGMSDWERKELFAQIDAALRKAGVVPGRHEPRTQGSRALGESARKRAAAFVAEIDADVLAFRLMQIGIGLRAPPGTDATKTLDDAERTWPMPDASGGFPFRRMAHAAIEYLGECIAAGCQPS